MSEEQILVGRVRARIGEIDYAVDLQAGKHRLVADEPASHGGNNAGPGPFALLLSGLAACTAITSGVLQEEGAETVRQLVIACKRDGSVSTRQRVRFRSASGTAFPVSSVS